MYELDIMYMNPFPCLYSSSLSDEESCMPMSDMSMTRVPIWTGLHTTPGAWEAWRITMVGIAGEKGLYDLLVPEGEARVKVVAGCRGRAGIRGTHGEPGRKGCLEEAPGSIWRDVRRREASAVAEGGDPTGGDCL